MTILGLFLAGLFSLTLGATVVIGQPRRIVSWLFFSTTLATTFWSVGVGLFLLGSSTQILFATAQTYYIAAAMIAPCMLLTLRVLAGRHGVAQYFVAFFPGLIISFIILLRPHFLIEDVTVGDPNSAKLNDSFYMVYVFYFVSYYLFALLYSIRVRSKMKHHALKRMQIGAITQAYIWAGVIGMIFNLLLPAIDNYSLIWIGPLCLFIFVPMVYISIAKHQLFDLKQAIVRTAAYVLSIAVLSLVYFGLAYIASVFIMKDSLDLGSKSGLINILLALILAFLFQPVKQFFDKVTDRIFFRNHYDSDELIGRLGDILTSTTHLKTMLEATAEELQQTLKASYVSFTVYREDKNNVTIGTNNYPRFTDKELSGLYSLSVSLSGDLLLIGEAVNTDSKYPYRALLRVLERRHAALLLPLGDNVGYLLLGDALSSGYSQQDVKLLSAIGDELAIAIENARSVQEVRELNTTLQQRIDHATQQLRTSNEKLRKLDATKDEFISMASHQLRTPLTSIKGYLSMVLEGDMGEVNDQQQKVLSEAYSSSERMVRLIGDFLNVSRLQTGKFVIDAHPTDLAKVIGEEVESMQRLAESHGMTLVYKHLKKFPTLNVDADKLRQVIMNFIDNAIYYSRPGATIAVKAYVEADAAVIEVHDQGIGVPEEDQAQLFTKFFRAENARRQRPDGTGVGLFLASKVVSAQGGEVVFTSREGKGSMFGFRLPIKKLSKQ